MPGHRIVIAPVVTMDPDRPRAGTFAVAGGRITAVGTPREVRAACPADAEVEHLDATVVPGLIDAHLHMQRAGLKALSVPPPGGTWDVPTFLAEMDSTSDDDEWPDGALGQLTMRVSAMPYPDVDTAITGTEALAGYTTGAAYAAFADTSRGMLRAGMLTDWTALSTDPTTCTPDEIRTATVLRTVVGGITVHSNQENTP